MLLFHERHDQLNGRRLHNNKIEGNDVFYVHFITLHYILRKSLAITFWD